MKMFKFLLVFLPLAFLACNSSQTSGDKAADASAENTEMDSKADLSLKLTPFSKSASFPDASIESMAYNDGKFDFEIGGDSYKLGVQTTDAPQKSCANSAQGQHIHLIVNNLPYAAKYTSAFDYTIPDGEHYILAFLSRSYHESIKTNAAHRAVKAQVKDNSFTEVEPITDPMLFYSRPKGVYTGEDTKKVMLDFYLVNANMDDYKVKAEINGEAFMLDSWQPYYIEGLPNGDNTIKLTLVDNDGNVVPAPYNPVSRTFKLEGEPPAN